MSPRAYDTPAMDPSRHSTRSTSSRLSHSTSTLRARPSDAGVRRDTNIMDTMGPSTPHSQVRETPECSVQQTPPPIWTQPEFSIPSTQPTPQWSDAQDVDFPYSGSLSFTELLQQGNWGPQPDEAGGSQWQSQPDEAGGSHWQTQPDEAGASQWYPQSCVDQAPSQYVLQTSGLPPHNPTEWYAQHHHTGSDYTFTRGHSGQVDDNTSHILRQGPSQAAGQRGRRPPDSFTPEDFVHRQRGRRGYQ